ncbi:MAG TPA: hypothetical protein VGK98_03375 [Arthrobacter sp.]|uniref:hypothetical protein n=1 Tax=Arthrobacter sp. TaxID=1667 RepID=UPI002F3E2E58
MTEQQAEGIVQDLGDLAVGDVIEASHKGRRYNRGKVLQTIPSMGMFWILDAASGTRKQMDFEALLIRRVPEQHTQNALNVA